MKYLIIVLSLIGWMAVAEEPMVKKEETIEKKATVTSTTKVTVSKKKSPAKQKTSSKKAIANKTSSAIAQKAVAKKMAVQKTSAKISQASSAPALSSALKKADYKTTEYSSIGSGRSTTGFFSLSLGHQSLPLRYFEYYDTTIGLRYGGYVSEQSSFEAGINMSEHLLIMLKYNYDFIKGQKWIPGLDVSLLVGGFGFSHLFSYKSSVKWLDVGLEIGPYIKTFISRSHALFLRTGLAYDTSQLHHGTYYIADSLRFYLNLGIQWHF